MYKIIGANQQEYGPITADQLRQWIAEGRVNGQTPVQAEGDATWKPLSMFPEFASSFPGGIPPAPSAPAPAPFNAAVSDDAGRARAISLLTGPAIALIITAALGMAYSLFAIAQYLIVGNTAKFYHAYSNVQNPEVERFGEMMGGAMGVGYFVLAIILWALVIWGSLSMRRLQRYGLAMAASIIAMTPCVCPCCIFGLPFGIWALVVLCKADVKQHFR